jgi:hypothetical protein
MGEVSTIGLDIAKSVFQIHGVDVDGWGDFDSASVTSALAVYSWAMYFHRA